MNVPSEAAAIVAAIPPDEYTDDAAVSSGYVSAGLFHSYMAVLHAGTIASTATITFKLEQATDSSGTAVKDITGFAITPLADTDDDKQAIINILPHQLDVLNGFNHIRMTMELTAATADVGALLYGLDPRTAPASDNDSATVAEIVIV